MERRYVLAYHLISSILVSGNCICYFSSLAFTALNNQLQELKRLEPSNYSLQKALTDEIRTSDSFIEKANKADKQARQKTDYYKDTLGLTTTDN